MTKGHPTRSTYDQEEFSCCQCLQQPNKSVLFIFTMFFYLVDNEKVSVVSFVSYIYGFVDNLKVDIIRRRQSSSDQSIDILEV